MALKKTARAKRVQQEATSPPTSIYPNVDINLNHLRRVQLPKKRLRTIKGDKGIRGESKSMVPQPAQLGGRIPPGHLIGLRRFRLIRLSHESGDGRTLVLAIHHKVGDRLPVFKPDFEPLVPPTFDLYNQVFQVFRPMLQSGNHPGRSQWQLLSRQMFTE